MCLFCETKEKSDCHWLYIYSLAPPLPHAAPSHRWWCWFARLRWAASHQGAPETSQSFCHLPQFHPTSAHRQRLWPLHSLRWTSHTGEALCLVRCHMYIQTVNHLQVPNSGHLVVIVQVPQSRRKGHVDRLRAEEKWQSRARLTETSFTFLEAQKNEELSQLPLLPQKKPAGEVDDWHFEKPQVCKICYYTFTLQAHFLQFSDRIVLAL